MPHPPPDSFYDPRFSPYHDLRVAINSLDPDKIAGGEFKKIEALDRITQKEHEMGGERHNRTLRELELYHLHQTLRLVLFSVLALFSLIIVCTTLCHLPAPLLRLLAP